MLEPLDRSHVSAVTQLHLRNLTGLLRDLGPAATAAFYHGAARSGSAIGLVYRQDGRLAGFVLGSANPGKLRREILANSHIRTLAGMCAGVIRQPKLLRALWSSLLPGDPGFDPQSAELTYLAVEPDQRAAGIGRQLVERFSDALRALNVTAFELSVDSDNGNAIGFYERLGFVEVGQYREFGIDRKRLRKELG